MVMEDEDFILIKGKEEFENREWLERSINGVVFGLVIFDIIEGKMVVDGILGIKVRFLGGLKYIVIFELLDLMEVYLG